MADAFLARYTLVPHTTDSSAGALLADAVAAWLAQLTSGRTVPDGANAHGPLPALGWDAPVRWRDDGESSGAVELRWTPFRFDQPGGVVERVECAVRHADPEDPTLRWTTRLEFLAEPVEVEPAPPAEGVEGTSAGALAPREAVASSAFGAALHAALAAARDPSRARARSTHQASTSQGAASRASTRAATRPAPPPLRAALVVRVMPAMDRPSRGRAGDAPGAGASLRFAPPPALLSLLADRFTMLGSDGSTLARRAYRLRASGISDFVHHVLCNPARAHPVVVLTPRETPIPPTWDDDGRSATANGDATGRAGTFVLTPEALAAECFGVADVYVIERPEDTFALTDVLGDRRLSAFLGALRAYLPGFGPDADPYAHPLLLADRAGDAWARGVLVRRLAHETVGRYFADHVLDERLEHWADERRERLAAQEAERRAQLYNAFEDALLDATADRGLDAEHLAALRAELAEAREALEDLRAENVRLRDELREARGRKTRRLDVARPGSPTSVVEAVEQAAVAFADALYILPSALRAARGSTYRQPGEVWRQLAGLAHVARQLQEGSLGGALHQAFRALGLDYAPGITRGTGDRLRQQYRFYGGAATYVCEEHLRKGNDPSDGLRIYFTTQQLVDGRVVVGHVGAHLRTVMTN